MALELRSPDPGLAGPLADFFDALTAAGDGERFHPHPLDRATADEVAGYRGRDAYVVAVEDGRVLAYGLLRGWDDGFEVPSLGIAVHPDARGRGLGRAVMEHLHGVARERGAVRVRLRVYPDNEPAIELYRSLGYVFGDSEDGQRVGILELPR